MTINQKLFDHLQLGMFHSIFPATIDFYAQQKQVKLTFFSLALAYSTSTPITIILLSAFIAAHRVRYANGTIQFLQMFNARIRQL